MATMQTTPSDESPDYVQLPFENESPILSAVSSQKGWGGRAFNRFPESISRRRPMVQEGLVPGSESVTILLNQRRRHRRIPEPRMLFHARWSSLRDISPCSFESSVETLPAGVAKFRRRWWRSVNNYRLRMRAPSQRDGQQQSGKCNPFLHIVPRLLICGVPSTFGPALPH